jgi:Xaa-Pro aminopeptidase
MIVVPENDLQLRLNQFKKYMAELDENWEACFIFGKINMYYFTGTMQNGAFFIPRDASPVLYVRKSYERALIESKIGKIVKINSFRDIAEDIGNNFETVHIEKEVVPVAFIERFNKYFGIKNFKSLDMAVAKSRAVKTDFELSLMKRAGEIHRKTQDEIVPTLLKEGISEAELGSKILQASIALGSFGLTRMGSFNAELYLGNICFDDSGNYYNSFDGPAGIKGLGAAVPLFGSFEKKLKKDSVVLLDTACDFEGYHTDKTAIYAFGKIPQKAYDYHQKCVEIQNMVAERLKPGNIPEEIYFEVMNKIDKDFDINFMGFGPNKVKFLGHGIGLVVDEYPVIAKGFKEPLVENIVMAIEPKKGIENVGMVGTENTFVVTKNGGVSLTGNYFDIIQV